MIKLKNSNKNRIKTHEAFVERIAEIKPDIEILGKWNGSQKSIEFLHKKCNNKFFATPNNMLKETYGGCPECAKIKRKNSKYLTNLTGTIEKFENKLKELYPNDEYILIGKEYINNKVPVEIKCTKCGYVFGISYVNLCKGKGCKYCNNIKNRKYNSKGTILIEEALNKFNIPFEREVTFKGCKNIKQLYFDFYIEVPTDEEYILIEFDGELHYKPFNGNSICYSESFEAQLKRDNIKNEFCKKNNITLIRISYKEKNKINQIIKEKVYKKYFT